MKYLRYFTLLISVGIVVSACDNEDFTGGSRLIPTSPIIEVTLPSESDLNDPSKDVFEIHVSMDVAQIVDVAIHSKQTAGTAVADEDYDIEERIVIPKGQKEGSFTLHINSDELLEGPLTVTLQIGDARTANAQLIPVTFTVDRN